MLEQQLTDISSLINKNIEDYKIESFLSSGSFGTVYLATKNNKKYAIKLFKESYLHEEYKRNGENNRIKREIDIVKSISHDCLIAYEDDFTYEHQGMPHYCLVMEYFEGITLRELLKVRKCLPEEEALFIFSKILEGMSALHHFNIRNEQEQDSYGIIHRDLKPENIMINKKGEIRILDFGISKVIDYTSITATGDRMGTWAYMSPEQIIDSKHISKRSDLYSLGVILYELLTGQLPYKATSSLPELINLIAKEPPIEPRIRNLSISNATENIILKMLEKYPYKRFQSIELLLESLNKKESILSQKQYDLTPRFVLRLHQEKTALDTFLKDGYSNPFVDFPANLQYTQKGLLDLISKKKLIKIIDPATARLAYDVFQDNKGLSSLPYAPKDFNVITPNILNTYEKQRKYVELVLDEQARLNADILLSPFHYVHNSTVIPTIDRNPIAEWLDLDIKLLRESIDYKNANPKLNNKEIYAGICLHAESLSDPKHRDYILNTFSAFDCDGYLIYADCIDNDTNAKTLYNYIKTMQLLQKNTMKPIISGRVNPIGIGLICAGITGFTSGAAKFDKFYEDLYKDDSVGFNIYERYYFPELLSTIGIKSKQPSRLIDITNSIGKCTCPYCKDKSITDVIKASNNKLHFLYSMNNEINEIKKIEPSQRINYFLGRIKLAQTNFRHCEGIFIPKEYAFLNRWKAVFEKLNEDQKNQ